MDGSVDTYTDGSVERKVAKWCETTASIGRQ